MPSIFEFLLKHPDTAFSRGIIALKNNWFGPFLPILLLAILAVGVLSYLRTRHLSPWVRIILGLLRGLNLAVILLLLMKPVLVVPSVLPEQSFVAMVYDVSRSMTIRDGASGETRLEQLTGALGKDQDELLKRLATRFKVRHFRFSATAERADWPTVLEGLGDRTNLQRAIAGADAELRGVPTSGIVLLTDGADNASRDLQGTLATLRSRNIPVYTVGIGAEVLERDIDLVGVFAVRKALEGEAISADVAIKSRGYAGSRATLVVEEGGRVLSTEELQLPPDEESINRRLTVTPTGKGIHHFTFRVQPLPGEFLTENNSRDILLRVADDSPKILHLEGEPRWEYKFLRRALEGDQALRLSSLLRTGKNQYLRQGVDEKDQMLQGFPKDKATLYEYKGMILGSIEAAFFTADQLRMVEDFVGQRGGGLIMLGGRKSFAEGGFQGTPVEKALPVELDSAGDPGFKGKKLLRPQLTAQGRIHPITRFSPKDEDNLKIWESLPALTAMNRLTRLKAGATELIHGESTSGVGSQVLLAFQRYGRGRSLALGSDSTWFWKMQVPHDRNYLESFWRQLLRWMISNTPDRVEASCEKDFLVPGEAASIQAEVFGPEFISLNRADVSATLLSPSGQTEVVSMDWNIGEDGFYAGSYLPKERGLYTVTVAAEADGKEIGSSKTQFFVGDSTVEFHEPTQNRPLLEQIARDTGGKYYTLGTLRQLPEDLRFIKNEASTTEELDLWDLPMNFLVIFLLLAIEWFARKRLKLA
jgi:uncharacterized membrane protein